MRFILILTILSPVAIAADVSGPGDYASVSSWASTANAGDTYTIIGTGPWTWSNKLTITKGVNIIGQG